MPSAKLINHINKKTGEGPGWGHIGTPTPSSSYLLNFAAIFQKPHETNILYCGLVLPKGALPDKITGISISGMADVFPLMPPLPDLPEAVVALRDERQRSFVWHYMLNGGDGAKAARLSGYSDVKEACKVRASQLLQRADIQAALQELCTRYLFSLAPKAVFRLGKLLDDPKHKHHAKAIDMTLSRTGFGERTAVDVNVSGSVQVNHTREAVEQLRMFRGMGVPREKLVEIFGFSGLERYEKMLVEADAKVIEHEASA